MMSVMGQKSKSKRRHENKQQARENSSKPGETQESVENIRFLEWPKNFYVPDGVGIHSYVKHSFSNDYEYNYECSRFNKYINMHTLQIDDNDICMYHYRYILSGKLT